MGLVASYLRKKTSRFTVLGPIVIVVKPQESIVGIRDSSASLGLRIFMKLNSAILKVI